MTTLALAGARARSKISAADANRQFSRVLREVREGRTYVVTSHGRPVARIVPIGRESAVAPAAQASLFCRLESQRALRAARWTRDELYEQ